MAHYQMSVAMWWKHDTAMICQLVSLCISYSLISSCMKDIQVEIQHFLNSFHRRHWTAC